MPKPRRKGQDKTETKQANNTTTTTTNNNNNNNNNSTTTESNDTADQLKDKGNKAFVEGRFDVALTYFTKAIEKDPKNHVYYSNRSATQIALKKYDSALQDASECIKLSPQWPKGYLRVGEAYEQLLQYPEARETFEKGLALINNSTSASSSAANSNNNDGNLLKNALNRISSVMDELKMGQAHLQNHANPEEDKFENMCRWLREGGARFPTMYLQYYSEDYRGVHSLTKTPANQIVLYVPLSHIMTSEVAKASDIGRKIVNSNVHLQSTHSFLAAYLLQEKHNPNSFWKPYLDILPQKYRNMPIFFTPEELKWLKGSFTRQKIDDRIEALREEYETIKAGVPEFGRFTLWEFIWGRLVVITRIFGLVIKGNKTDGLVPYADMLNHKRPRETSWTYDEDMNGFTITSLKTILRGDEIFDSYGRKCNSRFFINYGFTLDDNEDNEAVVKVTLPRDSNAQIDLKIRMLGSQANALREFQVPATYAEKKTKELFSFLRFGHAQGSEMALLPADTSKLDDIEPLSIRNEIAVLKHIRQAAQVALQAFETTIEQDREWLNQPREKQDNNLRNCTVMRLGEKTVLQWLVDLANQCIPLLETPWTELKKIAAKASREVTPADHYVTRVVAPLVKFQK